MGYRTDQYLQRKTVDVTAEYGSETFTGNVINADVTARVSRYLVDGSIVRGDLYTVTLAAGETLCFALTNTSDDGSRLDITAQTKLAAKPGAALRGDENLLVKHQEIDNSGFYTLTNSGAETMTYYVTVGNDLETSQTSLSTGIDGIKDYVLGLTKTAYKLVTTRLDDATAPELAEAPEVTLHGSSVAVTWEKGTDNLFVAGYEYEITDGGGTVVASGQSRFNFLMFNDLAAGDYRLLLKAFDLGGNRSAAVTADFTVTPDAAAFYRGVNGTLLPEADDWTLLGEFSPTVLGNYYIGDFQCSTEVDLTVAIYDNNGRKPKLLTTARVVAGKLDADSIDKVMLSGGSYLVKVRGAGQVKVDYVFGVKCDAFPAATDDNEFAKAGTVDPVINGEATIAGWVGVGDVSDFYEFTADTPGELGFEIGDIDGRLKVTLYGENGKKLRRVTVDEAGVLFKDIVTPGDGRKYYISVSSADNGKGGENSPYEITMTYRQFEADEGDSISAPQGALASAGSVDGWVGYGDAADYYSVTITADEAGLHQLQLKDVDDKDAKITLYYEGRKIASITGGNGYSDYINLLVGKYTLVVESRDKGKGKYNSDYTVDLKHWTSFGAVKDGSLTIDKINSQRYSAYISVALTAGSYDLNALTAAGFTYELFRNSKGALKAISAKGGTFTVSADDTYYIRLFNATAAAVSGDLTVANNLFGWTPATDDDAAASSIADASAASLLYDGGPAAVCDSAAAALTDSPAGNRKDYTLLA